MAQLMDLSDGKALTSRVGVIVPSRRRPWRLREFAPEVCVVDALFVFVFVCGVPVMIASSRSMIYAINDIRGEIRGVLISMRQEVFARIWTTRTCNGRINPPAAQQLMTTTNAAIGILRLIPIICSVE
jgi:hypothetical protein